MNLCLSKKKVWLTIKSLYIRLCPPYWEIIIFLLSVSDLLELLKVSFPVRLLEKDKMELQQNWTALPPKRLSISGPSATKSQQKLYAMPAAYPPPATLWCIISLLAVLVTFFAVVTFSNVKLIRSDILTETIWVYVALVVLIFAIVTFTFYKHKT